MRIENENTFYEVLDKNLIENDYCFEFLEISQNRISLGKMLSIRENKFLEKYPGYIVFFEKQWCDPGVMYLKRYYCRPESIWVIRKEKRK